MVLLGSISYLLVVAGLAIIFLGILYYIFYQFSFYVRRLHDLGQSGWLALLLFVPMVNVVFSLILIFKKGDIAENTFGSPVTEKEFLAAFLNR